ncbi:hypothetical protein HYH03_004354 [Edaphochlamys debaryana]|uniref:Uncharacterized protein n=1 Tax=Edaphochlamys debaryana TaxID=47281 RepID=A0A835Y7C3_9CHLO|nr:hypothetical protein HYH03_004354 [Edaphochlamys debaryana]|eukprot:KAG2497610.1 hypothetical protein HYH03_004354 [Edaphochlamys debaryana]
MAEPKKPAGLDGPGPLVRPAYSPPVTVDGTAAGAEGNGGSRKGGLAQRGCSDNGGGDGGSSESTSSGGGKPRGGGSSRPMSVRHKCGTQGVAKLVQTSTRLYIGVGLVREWLGGSETDTRRQLHVKVMLDGRVLPRVHDGELLYNKGAHYYWVTGSSLRQLARGKWFLGWRHAPDDGLVLLLRSPKDPEVRAAAAGGVPLPKETKAVPYGRTAVHAAAAAADVEATGSGGRGKGSAGGSPGIAGREGRGGPERSPVKAPLRFASGLSGLRGGGAHGASSSGPPEPPSSSNLPLGIQNLPQQLQQQVLDFSAAAAAAVVVKAEPAASADGLPELRQRLAEELARLLGLPPSCAPFRRSDERGQTSAEDTAASLQPSTAAAEAAGGGGFDCARGPGDTRHTRTGAARPSLLSAAFGGGGGCTISHRRGPEPLPAEVAPPSKLPKRELHAAGRGLHALSGLAGGLFPGPLGLLADSSSPSDHGRQAAVVAPPSLVPGASSPWLPQLPGQGGMLPPVLMPAHIARTLPAEQLPAAVRVRFQVDGVTWGREPVTCEVRVAAGSAPTNLRVLHGLPSQALAGRELVAWVVLPDGSLLLRLRSCPDSREALGTEPASEPSGVEAAWRAVAALQAAAGGPASPSTRLLAASPEGSLASLLQRAGGPGLAADLLEAVSPPPGSADLLSRGGLVTSNGAAAAAQAAAGPGTTAAGSVPSLTPGYPSDVEALVALLMRQREACIADRGPPAAGGFASNHRRAPQAVDGAAAVAGVAEGLPLPPPPPSTEGPPQPAAAAASPLLALPESTMVRLYGGILRPQPVLLVLEVDGALEDRVYRARVEDDSSGASGLRASLVRGAPPEAMAGRMLVGWDSAVASGRPLLVARLRTDDG